MREPQGPEKKRVNTKTLGIGALLAAGAWTGAAQADLYSYTFNRPSQAYIDANTVGPWTYEIPDGQINESAGILEQLQVSYDDVTNDFTWSLTFGGQPGMGSTFHTIDGFWFVLTAGGMPSQGEAAMLYFDNTGPDPVLTGYGYNGLNSTTSYMDGSNAPGIQPPDPIFSTINNPALASLSVTGNPNGPGTSTWTITMDADVIQNHIPTYADPADYTGLAFGQEIGIWLHFFTNMSTSYGGDGYLDSWNVTRHGWFDAIYQPIPAPGALALLGLAGLMGGRRRRTN